MMEKFDLKVILLGVICGAAFAGATIFALIAGYEHIIALLMFAGLGKVTVWTARKAPIKNAFAAGFAAAIVMVLTQAAFLDDYFAHNPDYRDIPIPFGLNPRVYIVMFAPLFGLFAGLVAAASAAAFSTLLRRRQ